MEPQRLSKSEALHYWSQLEPRDPTKYMDIIPYKASGSRYGFCGIRIDGSREFIDSVLSNLKGLLALENNTSRLELNYTEITDKVTQKPTGKWVCYIRAHERGHTAQMINTVFNLKPRFSK